MMESLGCRHGFIVLCVLLGGCGLFDVIDDQKRWQKEQAAKKAKRLEEIQKWNQDAKVNAPDEERDRELAEQTNGYLPEGPPILRRDDSPEPIRVPYTRGHCYLLVYRSDASSPRGLRYVPSLKAGSSLQSRGDTLHGWHMPGWPQYYSGGDAEYIGRGGYTLLGCPLRTDGVVELRPKREEWEAARHGQIVAQLYSHPVSNSEFTEMLQKADEEQAEADRRDANERADERVQYQMRCEQCRTDYDRCITRERHPSSGSCHEDLLTCRTSEHCPN